MTLFYCPLESYVERYTTQWAAPKTGWLERNWIRAGLDYVRVNGDAEAAKPMPMKAGVVLDPIRRSRFAFSQVSELLGRLAAGEIKNDDVLYFDDFWHPGIEALPYACHILGVKPRMYAFLHAQSVDEFDFTYGMRQWMRHFERGIGEALAGIFVCGPCLRDLVVQGGIAPATKVHITGHPFNSTEVLERMPAWYRQSPSGRPRQDKVVYSSRWDREKNPKFFLQVAERVIQHNPHAQFVVCTGAARLRSNDPTSLVALEQACSDYPKNILLRQSLTKEEYYAELCSAKVQMNTADQDFVAITLLESSVAGCYPLYPYFRSFPETFLHKPGFMYERLDAAHATNMLVSVLLRNDLWSEQAITARQWLHHRYDTSWLRMLRCMGLAEGLCVTEQENQEANRDPYQEE